MPEAAAVQARPHQRTTLVTVGPWLNGSGFTRVLRSTFSRLATHFDVHLVGIGYQGPVCDIDGFTLHPSNLRGDDVFGAFGGVDLTLELDAPLYLAINDLWMLHNHARATPRLENRARSLAYFPLDGHLHDERLLAPLRSFDELVVYTEFARAEVDAAHARLGFTQPTGIVAHGIDAGRFFPLDRAAARERALPATRDWQDGFIVLNANRPVPRKRVDLTIEGFARFAANKPANVKLYLHHALVSDAERAEIERQIDDCGMRERVLMTPAGAPFSDDALNDLYNACDVGINTAMGEGWGLVSFEHAATGAAQIVCDNSACSELWRGAAEMLPVGESVTPRWALLGMRACRSEDVALALERLYGDRELRETVSRACYERATRDEWSWDAVAERWRGLLLAQSSPSRYV